jgi:hypothetical protein
MKGFVLGHMVAFDLQIDTEHAATEEQRANEWTVSFSRLSKSRP